MAISILSPLDKAYTITTTFYDKVILGPRTGKQHNALDYRTPVGTPIYAVTDAKVTRADARDVWGGNIIQIDGGGVTALYAHLSTMLVKPGDTVRAGQLIGYTGNTGKATTGPHLYFEVHENGIPVDPLKVINGLVNPAAVNATLTSASTNDIAGWLSGLVNGNLTWNDWYHSTNNATWQSPNKPSGLTPEDVKNAIDRLNLGDTKMSASDAVKIAADAIAHGATHNVIPGADAAAAVGDFLLKAANPNNWAKFLAIMGGAGMIVWGGYIVWSSTG